MENGSSFEKNMKEKFLGYTEEPGSHVWENILSEIDKPQSLSEIIFPWAGPGLDVLVAILLLFQLNLPSFKMAQPGLVKNNRNWEEKIISNTPSSGNGSAANQIAVKNFGFQNPTHAEENFPANGASLHKEIFDDNSEVTAAIGSEMQAIFSDRPKEDSGENSGNFSGAEIVSAGVIGKENEPEVIQTPSRDLEAEQFSNFEQEGIVRVGLAPVNFESKKSLKEVQGKGLTLVYMTPGELKILPEDYSSGNPFRAETSKQWLLDIWYAPGLGFSSIESSKPEVKTSYLQMRDSSESPVYHGSFGVMLGRKINRLFYYSAGIQYNVREEKFSGVYQWDEPELRIDSIVHDKVINSTVPKVVVVEYDTVIMSSRKSKLLNHQVKFQTWEIPVRAGLRFDKENIVFSLQAGLVASWMTKVSGNLLEPVLMEEMKIQPGIERHFLLSGTLSAGVEWKLSNHLSMIAEPQYRYYFQSPYSNSFPLTLQWQSVSVLTGLRVRL